jgi:putative ATPase
MSEGALALIQAAVYLACAPKSNSLYEAHKSVISDVHNTINDPVPVHLRNSVTKLTRELGYGRGYKYPHDYYKQMESKDPERPPHVKMQSYLPDPIEGKSYYFPVDQGKEKSIRMWLEKRRSRDKSS